MTKQLIITAWNANGLESRRREVELFLINNEIDILLVSETHLTTKSHIKFPNFTTYSTNHPSGNAHGGTAIIIRNSIRNHEIEKYCEEHLQATTIQINDSHGPLSISAVYCPPKHKIKVNEFKNFFESLGTRFIVGGDYNAKNRTWGSRLNTTRGEELNKAIISMNLSYHSTGQPTYWPTDTCKIPDLIDFFIVKGISSNFIQTEASLDLSSDHTPIILKISTHTITSREQLNLTTSKTDWDEFQLYIEDNLMVQLPLKNKDEVDDAVEHLTRCIQDAAWHSTPNFNNKNNKVYFPKHIKEKVCIKRKLKRTYQETRHPLDKRKLNRATTDLKIALQTLKNNEMNKYLRNLSPFKESDYSLWKATRRFKRPTQPIPPIRKEDGSWARSNAEKAAAFAQHLANVFQPYPSTEPEAEREIRAYLETPLQMSLPIQAFTTYEIEKAIQNLPPHKAPGHDLITGEVLKKLPKKAKILITSIFNAVLRIGHYPSQWKVAQIILIPKPGKPTHDVSSYRPISLLPTISKALEKLLLQRLNVHINENNLIPNYQFGFRKFHSTIEQVHRIVNEINKGLEESKYCSAAFIDVAQAFDKVWHTGLLYKIKRSLPSEFYIILKSYLLERFFQVKQQEAYSKLHPAQSGVPQGSVLGPVLYLLYTADLPSSKNVTTATYADDTAVITSHEDHEKASEVLQEHLTKLSNEFKRWRIRVNEAKSTHVTFTNRKNTCPSIKMNDKLIPQADTVKYLGMHLDRRLTWKKHITTKRKELDLKFKKMYWLLGRKSALSLKNKILLYKVQLMPIWTYGIQLWGTASNSNLEILQRFQSKLLRAAANAPWYISNVILHNDLQVKTVKEIITSSSFRYQQRLENHPNYLALNLLDNSEDTRRLARHTPLELVYRFS